MVEYNKGKFGLLRKNKGVFVKNGYVYRRIVTKYGGIITVKSKINKDTGDINLTRRLARLIFNF